MLKKILSIFLMLLITGIGSTIVFGQDFRVTAKETIPMLLNALNYNITLKDKIKKDCIIAVLYNPESVVSEKEKEIVVDEINDNDDIKVHDSEIKVIEIPMVRGTNLEKKIIIKKINAFWVTSELKPYLQSIRESAKYNQVITLSTDENLVFGSSVAMGAEYSKNGYKLVVNMNEAHNLNLELNPKLFSMATLIK